MCGRCVDEYFDLFMTVRISLLDAVNVLHGWRDCPAGRHALLRGLLDSFPARVGEQLCPLICDPLVGSFWPLVRARAKHDDHLGLALAQGRHQLEGQWGANTLEIPQSRVCQLEAFYWFTAHLLAHLPRFWECYNLALSEFRRARMAMVSRLGSGLS